MILPGFPIPRVSGESQVVRLIYSHYDNRSNGNLPSGLQTGDLAIAHAFSAGATLYNSGTWSNVGTLLTGVNRTTASYRKALSPADDGASYIFTNSNAADYHSLCIFRPLGGATFGSTTDLTELASISSNNDFPFNPSFASFAGPSIVTYIGTRMEQVSNLVPDSPIYLSPFTNHISTAFYAFRGDSPTVSATFAAATLSGYSRYRGFRIPINL